MIRGINQQNIFADDEDHEKFMAILATYRKKIGYEIYAYCLMGNHVHLLIKEGKEILSLKVKQNSRVKARLFSIVVKQKN